MNWTEMLTQEVGETYHAAKGLIRLVDDAALGWKPASGENWMTTGQLIEHMTEACGACCRGFLTGDWSFSGGPAGDPPPVDALAPATGMRTATSVRETLEKLAADERVALDSIRAAGERDLATKELPAPWDPTPSALGVHFLHMVGHLGTHKAQLFYYLKLQGKPVHTGHLYGM